MATALPLLAIIDDDADVRIALTRLLASAGFVVESYETGPEFLRSLGHHVPDCAVLDLHMPQMTGFDVQVALGGHAALPVVVITGQDSPESRGRALRLGAKAYLSKPVDGEVLLGAIAKAIEGRSGSNRTGCGAPIGIDLRGLANGSAKNSSG